MEEKQPKVCRICFEDENDEMKLISPCLCRGFSKYIHEDCLKTWIEMQEQNKTQIRCEVCKYRYKLDRDYEKKCDPREGMTNNPHLVCLLGILILVKSILLILLYVIISKNYIDPAANLGHFIGILSIFIISFSCTSTLMAKLFIRICRVNSAFRYRIHPLSQTDETLNTTHILHSLPRLESISQSEVVNFSQEFEISQILPRK